MCTGPGPAGARAPGQTSCSEGASRTRGSRGATLGALYPGRSRALHDATCDVRSARVVHGTAPMGTGPGPAGARAPGETSCSEGASRTRGSRGATLGALYQGRSRALHDATGDVIEICTRRARHRADVHGPRARGCASTRETSRSEGASRTRGSRGTTLGALYQGRSRALHDATCDVIEICTRRARHRADVHGPRARGCASTPGDAAGEAGGWARGPGSARERRRLTRRCRSRGSRRCSYGPARHRARPPSRGGSRPACACSRSDA